MAPDPQPLDEAAMQALAGVTTATLTTVLLKKGLRNVWMRGTRPLNPGQPRLVGPAFTLRFVPAREDLATPESWGAPISTRAAIEATPEGYKEMGHFDQPNRSDKNSWPHPVVAGGRLYLRDQDVLLCYEVKAP